MPPLLKQKRFPNLSKDKMILQQDLSTSDLHLTGISVIKSSSEGQKAAEEEEEEEEEEEGEGKGDKDEEELPPSATSSPLRPPSPPLR